MVAPAEHLPPSLVDEVRQLRQEMAELRALLLREPPRQWETTAEAAARIGRAEQTIRRWAARYHIGVQHLGAWRIDPVLLDRLMADRAGAD
jgi:hypothetical protein